MTLDPSTVADLPPWLAKVAGDDRYRWAVDAWRRAAALPGAWFDAAKADKIVDRWPKIFRLTNDRFKGKPFRLLLWQEITVRLAVGWKMPIEVIDPETHENTVEHVRVFRRIDVWIPRKNGKSEFLAGLGVLFFAMEKVPGGEGYVFARDETQAGVAFNKMKDIISQADGLLEDARGNERITLNNKTIYVRETGALCQLLTGAAEGKHGKNPTVILGDEIHEWRTREIADTLRQGTGARLQPIELYASTAGKKQNRVGHEWFEESMAIMRGDIDQPRTLVVFFGLGEDDDWTAEETWKKANPSLGLTPTLDFLREEFKLAKGRPAREAVFRCYHLNQWVDSVSAWLPKARWAACAGKVGWADLYNVHKGRRAFVTCDVSSTRDFSVVMVVLPPDEAFDRWVLIPRFFIPEMTLDDRAAEDKRVDWHKWIAEGALETTPGDFVDQNFVQAAIEQAGKDFDLVEFGYDPWNAGKLVADLQIAGLDAEKMVEMRQGHATLGEPTKELERLVFAGLIEHGGHPVLAWMAGHCTVRFDVNMNYVPDKKSSLDKIDGIVAGVMGIGLALGQEEEGEDLDDYLAGMREMA